MSPINLSIDRKNLYMEGSPKPFDTNSSLEIERLELALESAGIGTWELDLNTEEIFWCSRAQNLFNFAGSDTIDFQLFLSHIHPDDRQLVDDKIYASRHQAPPAAFSTEFRTLATESGSSRWVLCKWQSHRGAHNTVRLLGTFVDITKEIESRDIVTRREIHARSFQTVVEQAPMAIGLLSGPEFVVEFGNDKIFEVWGKDASITGLKLSEALPEIDGQGFIELLQNVYQTGEPYFGNGSLVKLKRNGIIEDVYFDFVYSPMRSDSGSVTGVLVMAHDVTLQHNSVKDLAASESKFRALIDQAPMAICLFVGEQMVVELANKPMIGYWGKDESVIGKPLAEALPELVGQPFLDILDQILKTGEAYSSKNAPVDIIVDGKMSTYYFNFTYKPIFDRDGKIYGIINMSIDVTAQVLAQKALEESESKLRTVISSAPAAIGLFVGRDLVVELPNQSFIDIVGKGPDIVGIPLREVMPELENQAFLQILDDVFTTGVTYQSYGTQVNIVQNGVMTYNHYDITYSPVYDSNGNVYAILDIAIDVTERVTVERKIEESQLQLLALFEQSPIGIAMISKDNLTFTMANPFYGKLVGREPGEIVGKPLSEALPEIDGQGFEQLLQNVIYTGIPYHAEEQEVEIAYDNVLQTIYVNLAYQPQRDLEGNIIGVLVVATDLTQSVLNRKQMEESQAFLHGAIEIAELGTYSIDLRTYTHTCSNRMKNWFGLQNEKTITLAKIYEAVCPKDSQALEDEINKAITAKSDGTFQMEFTTDVEKTGVARTLSVQGKILYDKDGTPVTMIGTAQDVTVQRRAKLALEMEVHQRTAELETINEELAAINKNYVATNEELSDLNNLLQQSNLNLQQFAYVASHDLQEPLRKIQSFSNLLMTRYGESLGDGVNYLHRMQAAASRMSNLIEDLLEFSRLTSPKDITEKVSLRRIVNDALSDLELTIAESSASITVDDLPDVLGDKMQFSQLFLNLIGNALKFRKPDVMPVIKISSRIIRVTDLPPLVIVTRTAAEYHRIDVTDNGIGFDQQFANRIFQLFQRLHGKSQYSGTGIGLAICERVATNHGGGISATSQPGHGATFSVFLPVLPGLND
ncbi:PAS domain-containing protein [Dyadobacter sp. CY312]|uniref:PAS domain-containing protein n=1 Tax=Dyadobacter sp. CY312 TaxID=2907303 RepID=UPI001F3FCDFD|nr:PAS domain-containing protein [Dyadobacter sp. CY312]MCE7040420.1 PAS domain-containing protein [Dyadobacter sp. CY312]